jgi:hemin uptake protein HemP
MTPLGARSDATGARPTADHRGDAGHGAVPPAAIRIDAGELFHGRRSVVIVHHGQEYRLQITKAGKLILTK